MWAWDNGVARDSSTASGIEGLTQAITCVVGRVYRITADFGDVSGGSPGIKLDATTLITTSTSKTVQVYFTATATTHTIGFYGAAATYTIDNADVRDVSVGTVRQFLDFDGVDDYLDLQPFAVPFAQPSTIACAVQLKSVPASTSSIYNGTAAPNRQSLAAITSAWRMYAGGTLSNIGSTAPNTDVHIVVCEYNGASSRAWIDGVSQSLSANPGSESLLALRIATDAGNSSYTPMRLYGVVAVDEQLTDVRRALVESWLASISGKTL